MVATMTNLAFVLDQCRLDLSDLTPAEWVVVINEAKGYLTLEYLKGLKSLRQVLAKEDEGSFRRMVRPNMISNYLPDGIKSNTVFCTVGDIVGPPLSEKYFSFDEVPNKQYPKLKDKIMRQYEQETLLLGRRGEFYLLKAQWHLNEEEYDVGRTFPAYDCWSDLQSIVVTVLKNQDLEVLFASHPKLPFRALRRMFFVQLETNMSLESRAQWGKAQQRKLAGMLNRLGCPV